MTRAFVATLVALCVATTTFAAWVRSAATPPASDVALDRAAKPLVIPAHAAVAVVAGGCFWGTQEALRTVPGVLATQVGYTGGTAPNPTYHTAHRQGSGYVEATQIVYDPARVGYETILAAFFAAHDPTAPRPGSPTGAAYRSFVWAQNPAQAKSARAVIALFNKSARFAYPVATQVLPALPFHPAEERHQLYYATRNGAAQCLR